MMLFGTSFGGCLKSILKGEVSEDDVVLIIARTDCHTVDDLIRVVTSYYNNKNSYASMPSNYDYTGLDLDDLKDLARRLWENGKIHQPRHYGGNMSFIHPEMSREVLWLELNPVGINKHTIVMDAYEKYKMLDALTKND